MSARDTSGSAPQHSHPHNNTMSRNEKFWVDQVTVPPAHGERQGVGNDKGGGGTYGTLRHDICNKGRSDTSGMTKEPCYRCTKGGREKKWPKPKGSQNPDSYVI